MKNEIYDRPITHPAAWRSLDIGGREGLTHRMSTEHVDAFMTLAARSKAKPADATVRADWEHPALNALMRAVKQRLLNGHGAVVVSGLDMSALSFDDFARIYWGMGTHLGKGVVQSYRKDRIGLVQKEVNNPTGRGYLMDIELRSHTDFHEIIGLACARKAAEGGLSGMVSSLAMHNVMREECPHHLRALYEGYWLANPAGDQLFPERIPVFCNVDGVVSCYNQGLFMRFAAEKRGEELPAALVEAQKALAEIAARPELRADFMLEPGEILFFHNFTVMHSRTAFRDEGEQRRLLYRLWLNLSDGRRMHPGFTEMGRTMDALHEKGETGLVYPMFATGVKEAVAASAS